MDYRLAIEPLQRTAQSSSTPLPSLLLQEPDPLATTSSVLQSPSPLSLLTSFDELGNFTPQTTLPVFSTQPPSPITTPTPKARPHPHPRPIPTFTQVPDELLPYPFLLKHVNRFDGPDQERELARILALTDEERMSKDSSF